jgi:hypothetical protein
MGGSNGGSAGAARVLSAARRHMYKHLPADIRPGGTGNSTLRLH